MKKKPQLTNCRRYICKISIIWCLSLHVHERNVCLNPWVQDCATWNGSSSADCHWTPVSWCKVFACTGDLPKLLRVQGWGTPSSSSIFTFCHPTGRYIPHIQIFFPGLLCPASFCKPQGRLWAELDVSWQVRTSLQPTLGQLPRDLGPSRCPRASSLSCLALSRIGNLQMKTKGNQSIEILNYRNKYLILLSQLSFCCSSLAAGCVISCSDREDVA